jgi:hypothetical protein
MSIFLRVVLLQSCSDIISDKCLKATIIVLANLDSSISLSAGIVENSSVRFSQRGAE